MGASTLRIATWNTKQAVAPRKPLDDLWRWIEDRIDPDVIVLTEARVPETAPPAGWSAFWHPGGIGPRRRWGTVVAARGLELIDVATISHERAPVALQFRWPGTVVAADVVVNGSVWATVVGVYAITEDLEGAKCGHGGHSLKRSLRDLQPLFSSDRAARLIVAGDFNLLPARVAKRMPADLSDLIELTACDREPLVDCANCGGDQSCGHMWTHKNGGGRNAAVQQIDYVFASAALAKRVTRVYGGIRDFPEAWEHSDHAPVVAEFELDDGQDVRSTSLLRRLLRRLR